MICLPSILVISCLAMTALISQTRAQTESREALQWFKGNTHAHTRFSDGTKSAEDTARWYRDHGYNFLAMTDHHAIATVNSALVRETGSFILIPGEEVTADIHSLSTHINGLGLKSVIPAADDLPAQKVVDEIVEQAGLVILNHPGWSWLESWDIRRLHGFNLMEIRNTTSSDDGRSEVIWDQLLSTRKLIYGVAADDSHRLRADAGKSWVMVRAASLTQTDILEALKRGDFYSSTGVTLKDVRMNGKILKVEVEPRDDETYRIEFISKGRVVRAVAGMSAQLRLGRYPYIRARIIGSSGGIAWTQPLFRQAVVH